MPEVEAYGGSISSCRLYTTCNTSSDSLDAQTEQATHASALCNHDTHPRHHNNLTCSVYVHFKSRTSRRKATKQAICRITRASCNSLTQVSNRTLLENMKLRLSLILALITKVPEGVLQFTAAQQQLAPGFRAATQVNVQSIELLLEVS